MQSEEPPKQTEIQEEDDFAATTDFSLRTKRIAVAGVMAAVSAAVAPIVRFIPRIPGWGIALFDPVSLFWIIGFLVGGFTVGITSMTVGTITILFFDPTGPIGTLLKLIATAPMIVIPWLGVRFGNKTNAGKSLGNPKKYAIFMVIATVIRLIIMIPLNLVVVPLFFGDWPPSFIIPYTIILNSIQAFWDILIPYIVVYSTSLHDDFALW